MFCRSEKQGSPCIGRSSRSCSIFQHEAHYMRISPIGHQKDKLLFTHTEIFTFVQDSDLNLLQHFKQCLVALAHCNFRSVKAFSKNTDRSLVSHFNGTNMYIALFLAMRKKQELLGFYSSPRNGSMHIHLVPFTTYNVSYTPATPRQGAYAT